MSKKRIVLGIVFLFLATVQWTLVAQSRLPDTGQTQGFTNTFGEDADYLIYPPSLQANGNGTVTDLVTGLVWQQADGGEMTVEAAEQYCDTLTLGGFTDWRLPDAQEAFGILHHGMSNPAIDISVFSNTGAEYWWTRERQTGNATKVWVTNAGGGIGNHPKTETISAGGTKKIHARAVRTGANVPPTPVHFSVQDSTVLDEYTGLEWQRIAIADSLTWEEALSFAENLTLQGKNDWRLPNIKELESINDETVSQPSVSSAYFNLPGAFKYWSSTTLLNQPVKAWFMDTRFGVVSYDFKTTRNRLICVRGGQEPPSGAAIRHAEMLGRPTDHSITVQAFFKLDVEFSIEYGLSSGNLTQHTPWAFVPAGEPAEAVIDGLEADTHYYYRLAWRFPGPGAVLFQPEHSFHTQRSEGQTFTFVVQADPHLDNQSDTSLYRLCLMNQMADQPDFMVDLGDIIMSDKLKNAQGMITRDTVIYRCHLMRSYYETVCHSAPLFITLGNHEGEAGWQLNNTANNVAVYNTLERKKYFTNPVPDDFYTGDNTEYPFVGKRENYYAWHWGDALFVVLDPYWHTAPKPDSLHGWRWTLGKVQYDWLRSTLENSTAKFKFVFCHQLVGGDPDGRGGIEFANRYEWGGQNLDGSDGWSVNRPGWYKPVKDVLTENEVTIFFHGHDHFFGKQEKDCLIYQEVPQPSHPNFSSANQANDYGYFEGQILPNSGHLRVTVSPQTVKTEYVRAYLPQNETPTRHNRDVSAQYFIEGTNCYDTLSTGVPVVWNADYSDELIFPNPSVDEVQLAFSVQKSSSVEVAIVDAKGAKIRQLIEGSTLSQGRYQVTWDGKDGSGRKVPAGIYFYQVNTADGGITTGKIMRQ